MLDFKEENTTFDLKIPKFQFFKIGQPVGAKFLEGKSLSASAMSRKTLFFTYFFILPVVLANRWNLGILE